MSDQSAKQAANGNVDHATVAASDEYEQVVLRTHQGQRVFTDRDIFVLCRLDEINVMLDSYGLQRRVMTTAIPRNAKERHEREFGHTLAFGCCARDVSAAPVRSFLKESA